MCMCMSVRARVCLCVSERVCACVRACVRACVCVRVYILGLTVLDLGRAPAQANHLGSSEELGDLPGRAAHRA